MVARCCRDAGLSSRAAASAVRRRNDASVKKALMDATAEAVAAGAFGVPFMTLEGQGVPRDSRVWFGTDRLDQLAAVLQQPWLGCQMPSPKL